MAWLSCAPAPGARLTLRLGDEPGYLQGDSGCQESRSTDAGILFGSSACLRLSCGARAFRIFILLDQFHPAIIGIIIITIFILNVITQVVQMDVFSTRKVENTYRHKDTALEISISRMHCPRT